MNVATMWLAAAKSRAAVKRSAIWTSPVGVSRTGLRLQMSHRHSTARVLGLAALLFLLAGCDRCSADHGRQATAWEASPITPSDGPRFEDPDFVLEALVPSHCQEVGALGPPPGWKRLSIPIELRGTSARSVPVSPLLFSLEDQEGHRYRPTLAGCHPAFQPQKLSQGDQLDAHLSFDVAPGADRFELVFEPFLIGRPSIAARVDVPPAL